MSAGQQSLGSWGENLAAEYLTRQGYSVVDRNVRTAYGEVDLVVTKGDFLIFVEVKTRRSARYGWPEDSINSQKRAHLIAAAQAYLQSHPQLDRDWRIDVIAIEQVDHSPRYRITHYENAVSG